MKRLTPPALALFLLAASLAPSMSCATFDKNLPTILADVSEATLVISTIETFVDSYFVTHPNPSVQSKVDDAFAKVKQAAEAVLAAGRGAGDLTSGQTLAAVAAFETTYNDLLELVKSFGVNTGPLGPVGAQRMVVAGGTLTVPSAKELHLVARK